MEVNKLESKEVFILGFGGAATLTAIILSSMYFGHMITTKSNVQTPITVTAAQPRIEVNVPVGPAPEVKVTTATPHVDVHVPTQPAPVVNVTTPPAVVTVLDKRDSDKAKSSEKIPVPASANDMQPTPVSIPIKPEKAQGSSMVLPPAAKEEITIESLYSNAEKYIASYCLKKGLDVSAEAKRWNTTWQKGVDQAMIDNTDSSEQSYINRVVLAKRSNFDMEKASPDQIVEACRLFLRYRDARLQMLNAMNDALTKENLEKTVAFLAAGPK